MFFHQKEKIFFTVSGTSVGLIILLIYSIFVNSGDKPPCIQKIFSSIKAATGRQLKQSVNNFHNLILYLLLPAKLFLKIKFLFCIFYIILYILNFLFILFY
jgi:hypothetical protein